MVALFKTQIPQKNEAKSVKCEYNDFLSINTIICHLESQMVDKEGCTCLKSPMLQFSQGQINYAFRTFLIRNYIGKALKRLTINILYN